MEDIGLRTAGFQFSIDVAATKRNMAYFNSLFEPLRI